MSKIARRLEILVPDRVAIGVFWGLIGVLVVWSYGANNVPLPFTPAPLVDVVLIALLAVTAPRWWRVTADRPGRVILVALFALSAIVVVRLPFDLARFGNLAARDALFALEAWTVLLGMWVARTMGPERVVRAITIVFAIALAWFVLFPWEQRLSDLGPSFGIQYDTPLFVFTSAGFVAGWALWWFALRRGRLAYLGIAVAIFVVFLAQLRGAYLALVCIAGVAVVLGVIHRRQGIRTEWLRLNQALARVVAVGALVLLVLWILPPIPGRLGDVSPMFIWEQLQTLAGADGPGAGSIRDRITWFERTWDKVHAQPQGPFIGIGLGENLAEAGSWEGHPVRTPHNDFLETYARLGLAGLIPLVVLWGALVRFGWWGQRVGGPSAWLLPMTVLAAVVALTQPFLIFAYGGLVFWGLAGVILERIRAEHSRNAPAEPPPAESAADSSQDEREPASG
jgi:O-antigen ligase